MANDGARKCWYNKVVIEVVTLKASISSAANATSVIAALIATTSFIGPFQPPLGCGHLDGSFALFEVQCEYIRCAIAYHSFLQLQVF